MRSRGRQAGPVVAESLLRVCVESAPAAIAVFDRSMRYLFASRRWLADHGLAPRDIIGRSHYEVFPDIPERWKMIHRRCLAGGTERCDQEAFIRADGTVDWVRWEVRPWRDDAGEVGGIVIFSEVVTKSREMLEALRESERRYQYLYENAPDIFLSVDAKTGRVLRCNQTLVENTGFSKKEIVGRPVFRFYHPRSRRAARAVFQQFRKTGEVRGAELRLGRKDGGVLDVSVSINAVRDARGKILYSNSVLRDISARKKAEDSLRESEALTRQILTSMTQGCFTLDSRLRYTLWNPAIERESGLRFKEVAGRHPWEVFPERPVRKFVAANRRAFRGQVVELPPIAIVVRGGRKVIAIHLGPLRNAAGGTTGVVGVTKDITHHILLQEKLSRLNAIQTARAACGRSLLDTRDEAGYIRAASRAIVRIDDLGRGRFETIRRVRSGDARVFPVADATGERHGFLVLGASRGASPDSEESALLSALADDIGQGIRFFRAQEAIRDREASIAELAARVIEAQETERRRVAHELHDGVNQLLAALSFRIRSCQERGTVPGPAPRKEAELAQRAIADVRRIAQGLRPAILDELGLVAAVRSQLDDLSCRAPVRTNLLCRLWPGRLPERLQTGLFRIVQEAVFNAERHSGARKITVRLVRRAGSLFVEVADDGKGFPASRRPARLKPGAGMGIAGMKERAALLGGFFTLESRPGKGTVVRVRVPAPAGT